ncbi:MAG: prepilin-type N-terminal cleavage/methylation domain-containing protein [bacterium]
MLSEESGFTLIELVIVLIIIIILLTSINAYFVNLQEQINASACKANQLGLVQAQNLYYVDLYMNEGEGDYAEELEDLIPFIDNAEIPVCPSQGTYLILESGNIDCTIPSHKRIN